jgi:hypothetical protein
MEARTIRDEYLREILLHGDIQKPKNESDRVPLFGENTPVGSGK